MIRAAFDTARLHLRSVASSDEAVVLACLNDLAVSGWLSVVPYPYTAADFRQFQTAFAQTGATFAIEDAQGFAGVLGLEKAVLGYWLAPRAKGQGYATEAARGALALHFAGGGGDVGSGYFEGNAPSANVLRKRGFVEIGRGLKLCRALNTQRQHVDLQLTRADFRSN